MLFAALFVLIFFLDYEFGRAQNKGIETTGDVLLVAMPVAAFGTALIIGDKEGGWQFVKGALLNQAITWSLKYAINKDRPYGNGDLAFPSGHTSTTFQSAAFIQKRYGWKYGIPAYVLAGFTGYSRIQAHMHDGWDVLAGTVIGIGSAYIFTSPYQEKHMQLTFAAEEDQYLIGFQMRF